MVSQGRAHPPLTTCRDWSRHVGTVCRWSPCGTPSQRACPAAQALMPCTVAGGHHAGWRIGTEPALCQTSIRALQQVVLPVMPVGCRRAQVPQTCARRLRPARSCGSQTKGRRTAGREEAQMYQTKHDLPPAHTRAEVIAILNARLADSIDRMHHAKPAHGHVKGRALWRCTHSSTRWSMRPSLTWICSRNASFSWGARWRARSR